MKKFWSIPLFIVLILLSSTAMQYRSGMPTPPEPMNQDNARRPGESPKMSKHVDLAQLQKESEELASTAQTIPNDVAALRQGMLPKDLVQKLKQIEKLSKHIRNEVGP